MSKADDGIREDLETLELPPDATLREIIASYRRLRELYSKGSIATSPLEDELEEGEREELLKKLDDAYTRLVARGEKAAGEGVPAFREAAMDDDGLRSIGVERLDGKGLRAVREKLGVDLGEIELKSRVSAKYLESIEAHDFASLPEEVYVQGYISQYARYLGLDRARAVRDFMEAFREWRSKE